MRQLLFGSLVLLTACGNLGDRPWDANNDGLITACEGLNAQVCDSTPGCEREPVVCILVCRDDGHGGCLPCPESDVCRPVLPPPPRACAQLSPTQCGASPQCELVVETVCSAGSANGAEVDDRAFAPPADPPCGNECHTIQRCQDRAPVSCEALDVSQCLSNPRCAIVHDVAPAFAPCAPGVGCERPEVDPLPRCITRPAPVVCEQRDEASCELDGRCALERTSVCDVYCAPGTQCPPCSVGLLQCVPVAPPPPRECEDRDPSQCTVDGRCMLESGPVCDVACTAENCPPCANPVQTCVPLPVPSECATRDLNSCELDGQCRVEAYACPAICELEADGGCKPCNAPPAACVPALIPEPVQCHLLDEVSCERAGCELLYSDIACTTECRDDGDGGCLPCPNFICR